MLNRITSEDETGHIIIDPKPIELVYNKRPLQQLDSKVEGLFRNDDDAPVLGCRTAPPHNYSATVRILQMYTVTLANDLRQGNACI